MTLPSRWASQIGALAVLLAAALILGWWFGGPGWWLAAAALLYLVYTLRHLYWLDRALDGHRRVPLFETRGLWAEVFARVDKLRAKARNRKKKYHRLLREVRESTGALADGGIILNVENEIMWFNPAAARLLGLNHATDIGHRIDNLLRHPDFVAYLKAPTGDGITVASPRHDAGWLHVQIIPYGTDQRLAIIRDVTNEKNVERTRRDFVANASHELRSPLTVISGYLEALQDAGDVPEAWQVPVAEMQRQAERMTRILRDLIELTRLESADASAARDFIDVGGMLKLVVQEFQGRLGPTVELALETDAALLGKESELHSIFYNLVNNAVRFTPPSGSVQSRLARGRRRRRVRGHRYRHRHPRGADSARDGALLSRRPGPLACERRHRLRPSDRQARAATARGRALDREPRRRGQHVQLPLSAGPCRVS